MIVFGWQMKINKYNNYNTIWLLNIQLEFDLLKKFFLLVLLRRFFNNIF